MKRNQTANFAAQGPMSAGTTNRAAKKKLQNMAAGKGAAGVYKKVGSAIGAVKANPGKSGLGIAGLAAAGGLGMAGMKAIGAKKKKANSLQGRLSSAMKKMGR
jgi:hypothetical protein